MAQEQKDEEEFEMQLGPLKTLVFAVRASFWTCRMAAGSISKAVPFQVYYACNIIFLLAPGSIGPVGATPSCAFLALALPYKALTSWSKAENLMLGGAGLDWEIIWLWLVARGPVPTTTSRDFSSLSEFQVVLATDVVGYFFRALQATCLGRTATADGRRSESSRLQAAWMKRQISVTDPAIAIVMSAPASDTATV